MNLLRRVEIKHLGFSLAALVFLFSAMSYGESMGKVKFVDVDGVKTGYFEGGSGEAMVLVHGGSFGSAVSANCWSPIFDDLAAHFHVYVIDKLGQGYTDKPLNDADYTMDAVTRHIHRFMETLGLQKVHLVGHSRGALPTARIATDHPELIESLVLFNSGTLARDASTPRPPAPAGARQPVATNPPPPTKESIRQSLLADPNSYQKGYITDDYVEAELRVALLPKLKEAEQRMTWVSSQWVKDNPEKMKENPRLRNGWWYNPMKSETFERIQAGRLKSPTLIIWGFNDSSAPAILGINLYNKIASVLARAELHFFNQSGHYVFQEYPRETADLIVSFIKNAKASSSH
jgi:2-hydroxy-6-oxo-6-(2'-carboxyphenyl)-hexa-2,4-dienoate hydrolase